MYILFVRFHAIVEKKKQNKYTICYVLHVLCKGKKIVENKTLYPSFLFFFFFFSVLHLKNNNNTQHTTHLASVIFSILLLFCSACGVISCILVFYGLKTVSVFF